VRVQSGQNACGLETNPPSQLACEYLINIYHMNITLQHNTGDMKKKKLLSKCHSHTKTQQTKMFCVGGNVGLIGCH